MRTDARCLVRPDAAEACRRSGWRLSKSCCCFEYDLIGRWWQHGSRYVQAVEWEGKEEERWIGWEYGGCCSLVEDLKADHILQTNSIPASGLMGLGGPPEAALGAHLEEWVCVVQRFPVCPVRDVNFEEFVRWAGEEAVPGEEEGEGEDLYDCAR